MPKPPSSPQSAPGQQALEQAMMAFQMGRPDEAERIASGVLKANRGNILAAQILGRALLMQNRADEAIEPLRRARKRSEDANIETVLASALISIGQRDEALNLLRQTVKRQPPFLPAFAELGRELGKDGTFDEAIAVLERGLALAPDSPDLRMTLGHVHIKRNDRKTARALFMQVRTAAPERYDALVGLAQVMALDGEYAAAADLYKRAVAVQPDDALTRINLAKCLLELGDRDGGEAALRTAARTTPMAGRAMTALAAAPHGRFFIRPSAAAKFLRGG
jgi:predicted Zn-dependent protease